ncbi:chitin deacetylase [Phakopsora pachyrhizi]|uniref:chitin deacetylase n=1 Tax=Phakopsora pachyrhizi TaxID=170000 RepID=A0AAV0B2Z8_PHAPC|nr:chitin deacetylase [Phakopsora pachyrhizi]
MMFGNQHTRGGEQSKALLKIATAILVFAITIESLVMGIDEESFHQYWARQAAQSARATITFPAAAGAPTPAAGGLAPGDIQTGTYPPIAKSMATATMTALPAVYTTGSESPIPHAPRLPSSTLNINSYPALDKVPPTDSPQVKEWLSKIDMSKIPGNYPNGLNGCGNATNADALANSGPEGNCWWTCGGCTRETDIVSCPDQGTWGASFDDGPSPETPRLLKYLDEQKLKATFFVVGSRVLSRPQMLQYEYEAQHQISVHTWSHSYLTTLTNEQIVAELGWTKKVIFDTIGVTPNTMRPPYGDIDDRVRYIALAMGLTPIIWTTSPSGQTFDTQDWKIAAGSVTPAQVLSTFQGIISGAFSLPTGFIVLAHDLYPQSVALAVEFVLPNAISSGNLTIEPIISCLGKPLSAAYIETYASSISGNTTNGNSKTINGVSTSSKPKASSGLSLAFGNSVKSNQFIVFGLLFLSNAVSAIF